MRWMEGLAIGILVIWAIIIAAFLGYYYAGTQIEPEVIVREVPGSVVTVTVPGEPIEIIKEVKTGTVLPEVVTVEVEKMVEVIKEVPVYKGPREFGSLEELHQWLAGYDPHILALQFGGTLIELEHRVYGDADFAFGMAVEAHEQGYFLMMLADRGRCLARIGGRYYLINPVTKSTELLVPTEVELEDQY